ncbi:branched-chain amino acid ABC transporter permease [Azospirillum sp.]|uniref:branched-chain amino acid ABC transporter permease n=1 Tax=Azospirillum sp. TaxID=34012 RepID=UPI002D3110F1|nr:branched-chain amino acid ABC transporter permease [Azospirillum sp.]HYD69792.1 branched-chain amino acid ABC transporter permease [Azospirillum sp.]
MDASFLLVQMFNGIQYGLLLFLIASGLTLIFGIMGIINLAHGAFYMMGAYVAWWAAAWSGSLLVAVPVAIAAVAALGYLIERLLLVHLYERNHLDQVLLTYGLILVLNELQRIAWGNDVHGVAVPAAVDASIPLTDTLSFPAYRILLAVLCAVLAAALFLVIQKTRFGMWIRAGASNREMVAALGIDIKMLFAVVFAAGAAMSGFAGAIVTPLSSVYPGMGDQVIVISFVVVVIGGIGSVKGALLGALLIGLADTFGRVLLPDFASLLVYAVMAGVLLWRPQGLFARA